MDDNLRDRIVRQMAEVLLAEPELDLYDRLMCEIVASRRYHIMTMNECLDAARAMARIRLANKERTSG